VLSEVLAIARKELLDCSRDRRTILAMVVLPMVLMPTMMFLPSYLANPQKNPSTILLLNKDTMPNSHGENLTSLILQTEGLATSLATLEQNVNLTDSVTSGRYDLAVEIPQNFSEVLGANGTASVFVVYDQTNTRATVGFSIIDIAITAYSKQVASPRLEEKGVTQSDLNPIQVVSSVTKAVQPAQTILAVLLPMMVVLWAFMGGMYFVMDITAGEKERKTLEALLTTPPSRLEIVLGKYLAVLAMTLVSTVLALVGISIGVQFETQMIAMGTAAITPETLAVTAVSIPILAMSASALQILVCTFARSFKEAQNYLSPLMIVFILPITFLMYVPRTWYTTLLFLPFVSFNIILRNTILGTLTTTELATGISLGLIYALIFLLLAVKAFHHEKAIFRGT